MQRVRYRSEDARLNQQIIELLCECFGTKYRDYYLKQLEHLPSPTHTKLLADEHGRLVAFTQVVDYSLHLATAVPRERVAYLYSVCTAESHQGQGVMNGFMREIIEELRADGYALIFLVPAEDWLVEYYKKFGFAWQSGVIYAKAPQGASPLIYPNDTACGYLRAVAEYELKREGQRQYESHRHLEWIPLLPAPICWMSLLLRTGLALPATLPVLNPLT